jgi:methylated-DNA-[protein]-cysteine S-methyltransferase
MTNTASLFIRTSLGKIGIVWSQEEHMPRVLRILLPVDVQKGDTVADRSLLSGTAKLNHRIELLRVKIEGFLQGRSIEFSPEEMDLGSCSAFQKKVLLGILSIPRGKVMSYGHLSETIGHAGGARAVGGALAGNPFPLLFPCHRVVRETGDLGGFGGGIEMKRRLLEMEGVVFDSNGRVSRGCFCMD